MWLLVWLYRVVPNSPSTNPESINLELEKEYCAAQPLSNLKFQILNPSPLPIRPTLDFGLFAPRRSPCAAKHLHITERTDSHRIRDPGVVFAMTRQRAGAAAAAGAGVHERARRAGGGRDVIAVEIDQVLRIGHAVGIMAGRARGFLIDDVEPMPAALTLAVDGTKTLVTQDAVAAVAFVAERVGGRAFRAVVSENQLPFQQRGKNRAVRAIRPGAARGGTLVAIMAIRAFHQA